MAQQPSYSDIQKAVRVEKFRIWAAWFAGGFVMLGITNAASDVAYLGDIMLVLFVIGFVAFTFTAFKMTNALNRKAEAARREVLGDDLM
ncbi:hypothetical protein [Streptomyces sp. MJP52]|uniref:hypothetical protein n=1 Tax=Streptomyces sp. MJP52 TaxID=2940555 RepID=UPI002473B099|nr:hypothetical protein [Streptomyces sp. MJP52]MDH6226222.1 hypothetical protein [Streptomyces sp. MJP52]